MRRHLWPGQIPGEWLVLVLSQRAGLREGLRIAADKQSSEPFCLGLQEVTLRQILIPGFKITACNRETSSMYSTDGKCFHLLFFTK